MGEGNKPAAPAVAPTILLGATADMAICREASFAPITAVIPFETIDDAVSLAAKCPFGLAASVYTADVRAAEELAPRVPAGNVVVNDVLAPTAHPATPFGGRGASGWGVTQGAEGLRAMTTPQTVSVRRGRFRPHIDEAVSPDPEATTDILRGLLHAAYTFTVGARFFERMREGRFPPSRLAWLDRRLLEERLQVELALGILRAGARRRLLTDDGKRFARAIAHEHRSLAASAGTAEARLRGTRELEAVGRLERELARRPVRWG